MVGRTLGGFLEGGVWLLAGSLAGGTAGLVGWLRVMSRRRLRPPNTGSPDAPENKPEPMTGRSDETA